MALLAVAFAAPSPAVAHPHVWITAKSQILYAADGTVTGVRHAWTFDDAFSAKAVHELRGKIDAAYTRDELAPLARAKVESLKEDAYFTSLRENSAAFKIGDTLPFAEPIDYFFDYVDNHLTLHFTLPLKTHVKSKSVLLQVYDRSFFMDFQMAKDHPVELVGAPVGCKVWLQPSMGNERDRKSVQEASEDSFKEGGANAAAGLLFINKASVDCP